MRTDGKDTACEILCFYTLEVPGLDDYTVCGECACHDGRETWFYEEKTA